jgi:hypothetical protein
MFASMQSAEEARLDGARFQACWRRQIDEAKTETPVARSRVQAVNACFSPAACSIRHLIKHKGHKVHGKRTGLNFVSSVSFVLIQRRYTESKAALVSEDEDLGERERIGMRDSEQRGFPTDGGKATRGAGVQLQLRRAAPADHLAIAPEDSARVAGTERLHRRLFRGTSAGEVDGRHAPARAVRDFAVGEDAAEEAVAISFDGAGDAVDIGRVEPQPDDVRHDDENRRNVVAYQRRERMSGWRGRTRHIYINDDAS